MPLLTLLAQCVAVFVASLVIGYLPLGFKAALNGKGLKAVSVGGMGLLVGAALTIIIPEGVETLYGAYEKVPSNERDEPTTTVGLALLCGFALMLVVESVTPHPTPEDPHAHNLTSSPSSSTDISPRGSQTSPATTDRFPLRRSASQQSLSSLENGGPDGEFTPTHYGSHPETTRMDSSTLLFPKGGRKHSHSSGKRGKREADRCQESEGGASGKGVAGLNATLGLVIHAMADGIALGASSLSDNGQLGLVVFLAVIVHKGPTALGLTTTLLSLGLTPPQIRRRLLLFSASAPAGSIVTYLLVLLFGGGGGSKFGSVAGVDKLMWWTGVALLFSGGSFLYVATVIQPLSSDDHHSPHSHSHEAGGDEVELKNWQRLSLLGGGMVLPLALSTLIGHGH